MPPLLDYPRQCAELEKMRRLGPPRACDSRPAPLAPLAADATCLVCGARPARPCGGCGGVAYCGEAHQQLDARWHLVTCPELRAVAEDRAFAAAHPREAIVARLLARAGRSGAAPAGWDDYLGDGLSPVERRCMTDLATRPLTLAHVLTLLAGHVSRDNSRVTAIHVIAAAERERDVPLALWRELPRLVPGGGEFELVLVGPELPPGDLGAGVRARPGLYHRDLWGELGRPDLVLGYDCGLLLYPSWKPTILGLRGSGVPFVVTSYRAWEAAGEARVLAAIGAELLLAPTPNPFASLAARRSTTVANDLAYDNAFVSAWR